MSTTPLALILRLFGVLKNLTLEPAVPASILAILAFGPGKIKDEVLNSLSLNNPKYLSRVRLTLRTLLVLGLVRRINRALNVWALNNWRINAAPLWDWPHETAVVTGGCSGIGKAIVLGLAAKGIRVAIFDIQPLPEDLKYQSDAERRIAYYKCDVTSVASVKEACNTLRKDFGDPSILVNNAGVLRQHSIIDTTEDEIRQIIGVNLEALWNTTRELLPSMIRKNKGHIVTLASLASYLALPNAADYGVTKAGALAFHEALLIEIRQVYNAPGIMATIAHPSFVATPMTDPFAERIAKRTGKMLRVDDVANPILKQIFSRRGSQLLIPAHTSFLTGIRGWPNWVQEHIRSTLAKSNPF